MGGSKIIRGPWAGSSSDVTQDEPAGLGITSTDRGFSAGGVPRLTPHDQLAGFQRAQSVQRLLMGLSDLVVTSQKERELYELNNIGDVTLDELIVLLEGAAQELIKRKPQFWWMITEEIIRRYRKVMREGLLQRQEEEGGAGPDNPHTLLLQALDGMPMGVEPPPSPFSEVLREEGYGARLRVAATPASARTMIESLNAQVGDLATPTGRMQVAHRARKIRSQLRKSGYRASMNKAGEAFFRHEIKDASLEELMLEITQANDLDIKERPTYWWMITHVVLERLRDSFKGVLGQRIPELEQAAADGDHRAAALVKLFRDPFGSGESEEPERNVFTEARKVLAATRHVIPNARVDRELAKSYGLDDMDLETMRRMLTDATPEDIAGMERLYRLVALRVEEELQEQGPEKATGVIRLVTDKD